MQDESFSMFLRPKQTTEIFDYLPHNCVQNPVNCIIQIENSTALFFAISRNLIGTLGIAEFGPKKGQVFQSNIYESLLTELSSSSQRAQESKRM